MLIGKQFTFDASHQLPNEACYGKCRNLHGHTYKLEIKISGAINEKGWLMNFSDLKEIINKKIISVLDHTHLNDTIELPTAENIVEWIYEQIVLEFHDDISLSAIILWETPTSYAEWNSLEQHSRESNGESGIESNLDFSF